MMFSILMVTHNKAKFLTISIPTVLSSLDYEFEHEFLILDNGSTDATQATLDIFKDWAAVRVFRSEEHLGLNGYCLLAKKAKGDIIVTVDDDIFYITPNWERVFSRVLNTNFDGHRFAYVGSQTVNDDGGMRDEVWGRAEISGININVCPVGGWFAAIKRDVLDELGGFHSGAELMHLEDADIQKRAWKEGYMCGIAMPVSVFHARSPLFYNALDARETYEKRMEIARYAGIDLEIPPWMQ